MQQLNHALSKLPVKEGQHIYARYFLGKSCKEIAAAEKISTRAVQKSLRSGLKRLGEILKIFLKVVRFWAFFVSNNERQVKASPQLASRTLTYGYQLTTTKESNDRYIDVAPEFMEAMKKYYDFWKCQRKLMGASWRTSIEKKRCKYPDSLRALAGNNFVISDDHGWPLSPDSYASIVKRIGDKAGIRHLHPHMFRHTFVSILMSNPDIGVATVAAEAGHAQPSTTLMIYTQQYKKRQESIRNQLSRELYGT